MRRRALFRVALALAAAALVLVFRGGPTANPVSRALTVLALVEDGTLRADRWFDLTIDRAIVDGHVYSDKPPLSSVVVVPFYWLWRAFHRGPYAPTNVDVVVVLGDVVAAAVPFGAFVVLLYRRAADGMRPREAVWTALLAALGTPLFSYGATYFGHMLAGTLFVFAYDSATRAESTGRPPRHAQVAGLLAGLAVTADLTLWIGVVALAGYLAVRPRGHHLLAHYALGGLPCAIAFAAYNTMVTGSPFDWAYEHVTSTFYQRTPVQIDRHTLAVARDLLVSEYRGLLLYAPALLALAPLAVARTAGARRWLLVGYVGAHFLFVASYWMWAGGWCIGPRHLAPLMMVVLYEGVGALSRSAMGWRIAFAALASIGVGGNLLAVATNPKVEGVTHPFRDLYWPAFLRGDMTSDSVFRDLGVSWGRGTVYAWCALFVAAASVLAWVAERQNLKRRAPSAE